MSTCADHIICTALSILQDTKDMYEKADAVLNAVIMEYTVTPVRVLLFFKGLGLGFRG